MESWFAKNTRRYSLIIKKYHFGLDAEESAELDQLEAEITMLVATVDPQPTIVIDKFEEYARRLKDRDASKNPG
jgi:hypothetical protein